MEKVEIHIPTDKLNSEKFSLGRDLNRAHNLDSIISKDDSGKLTDAELLAKEAYVTFVSAFNLVKQEVASSGLVKGEASQLNRFLKNYALHIAADLSSSLLEQYINGDPHVKYTTRLETHVYDEGLLGQLHKLYSSAMNEKKERNAITITYDFLKWVRDASEKNLQSKGLAALLKQTNKFAVNIFQREYAGTNKGEEKVVQPKPDVSFDQIGGYEEIKTRLQVYAAVINGSDSFDRVGAALPNGIFLHGPPGCGKNLLVNAFVNSVKWPYMEVDVENIADKFYGEAEKKIAAALENPGIIVIDEFSSLGRDASNSPNDGQTINITNIIARKLNQNRKDRLIIAMDNNPELIHSKLKRGRRLGKMIYVGYPDYDAVKKILDIHLGYASAKSNDKIDYASLLDLDAISKAIVDRGSAESQRIGKLVGLGGGDIEEFVLDATEALAFDLELTGKYTPPTTDDFLTKINSYDLETRYG